MKTDEVFDRFAKNYGQAVDDSIEFSGQDRSFFMKAKIRHLKRIFADHNVTFSDPILDLGCGIGSADHYLQEFSALSAADISKDSLEVAKRANPWVTYSHYDGTTLPYVDGQFKAIFAICVMHHVLPADWSKFLSEASRALQPGGILVVFEHNPHNFLTRRAVKACPFDEGVTLVSKNELCKIGKESGFRVGKGRYIIFAPLEGRLVEKFEDGLAWLPLGAQYYQILIKD